MDRRQGGGSPAEAGRAVGVLRALTIIANHNGHIPLCDFIKFIIIIDTFFVVVLDLEELAKVKWERNTLLLVP